MKQIQRVFLFFSFSFLFLFFFFSFSFLFFSFSSLASPRLFTLLSGTYCYLFLPVLEIEIFFKTPTSTAIEIFVVELGVSNWEGRRGETVLFFERTVLPKEKKKKEKKKRQVGGQRGGPHKPTPPNGLFLFSSFLPSFFISFYLFNYLTFFFVHKLIFYATSRRSRDYKRGWVLEFVLLVVTK